MKRFLVVLASVAALIVLAATTAFASAELADIVRPVDSGGAQYLLP
ncbi:MAG TPA: hypothetical protein VFU46_15115 [Gemmatimonadales bacterium]|nr:hypothetical protein [Gemmatimonadales bacterium]